MLATYDMLYIFDFGQKGSVSFGIFEQGAFMGTQQGKTK
jgi:hypothetical protein